MRSLKAYWLPRLCPRTMCASSCESTIAKLPSSGSTSISPRLTTIVLPTLNVSSGEVVSTRVRTGQFNVVGDFNVVDYRLQNLVNIAFRSQQSSAFQAFDYVVFCLLLPLA